VAVGVQGGGDVGGEVAGDPPPQRGRGVVVRAIAFNDGAVEHAACVEPCAGQLRQPLREDGGERVGVHGGGEALQEWSPLGHGGLPVPGQALLEVALPAGGGDRELALAGGSGVGVRDAQRGPPHGDVRDGLPGGLRHPRRHPRWRPGRA